MFREEIDMAGNAAKKKIQFLRQQNRGHTSSQRCWQGMFVGFGVLLAFTAGGMLKEGGVPGVKFIMGGCFGVALSLVLMAGAELFTGSNFVMAVGMFQKKVTFQDSVTVWVTCWLGNLAGSVLVAGMYSLTGLCTGSVQAIMADTTAMKMSLEPLPLFMRAILCNILVCLAVWCGIKMKTETGKLIMTFWCLITFFTAGFEHSVANMSLMMIGLLNPTQYDISIGGYAYNLAVVTIGNMVGGIFVPGSSVFPDWKRKKQQKLKLKDKSFLIEKKLAKQKKTMLLWCSCLEIRIIFFKIER